MKAATAWVMLLWEVDAEPRAQIRHKNSKPEGSAQRHVTLA